MIDIPDCMFEAVIFSQVLFDFDVVFMVSAIPPPLPVFLFIGSVWKSYLFSSDPSNHCWSSSVYLSQVSVVTNRSILYSFKAAVRITSSFGLIDLTLIVANWNFFVCCCLTSLVVFICSRFLQFACLIVLVFLCFIPTLFLFNLSCLILFIDPGGSPVKLLQSCDLDR